MIVIACIVLVFTINACSGKNSTHVANKSTYEPETITETTTEPIMTKHETTTVPTTTDTKITAETTETIIEPAVTEPETTDKPTITSPKTYEGLWEVLIAFFEDGPLPDRTPRSESETEDEYEARLAETDAQWRIEASSYFLKAKNVTYIMDEPISLPSYDAETEQFDPIEVLFQAATPVRLRGKAKYCLVNMDDFPNFTLITPAGIVVTEYDLSPPGDINPYDLDKEGKPLDVDGVSGKGLAFIDFIVKVSPSVGEDILNNEPNLLLIHMNISAPDSLYYYRFYDQWYTELDSEDFLTITIIKAELMCKEGKVLYTWQ